MTIIYCMLWGNVWSVMNSKQISVIAKFGVFGGSYRRKYVLILTFGQNWRLLKVEFECSSVIKELMTSLNWTWQIMCAFKENRPWPVILRFPNSTLEQVRETWQETIMPPLQFPYRQGSQNTLCTRIIPSKRSFM